MYQQFFNFNTAPFSIAPDPHFIFMSEQHQEGLAHLIYGINQGGGFVVLTGEVGTGKTTLCHCLLQQLPDNLDIALVLNPKLSAIELLSTVCDELQIAYDQNKQTLKSLIDGLNQHLLAAHAQGMRTVLMIDEAQNLSLDVLEQVRLLTNLETSQTKLLQIILIGQPELKQLLDKPELRQLNQRITARYHLTPLSFSETEKYIKHRLSVCGSSTNIFNQGAIRRVFKLSQGIPRVINILCDRALLGAYVFNTQLVTKKIINQAAKEVFNTEQRRVNVVLKFGFIGTVILAMIVIFIQNLNTSKPEKTYLNIWSSIDPFYAGKPQALMQSSILPTTLNEQSVVIPAVNFKAFISRQSNIIKGEIPKLAELWHKDVLPESACQSLEAAGLNCLFDKSDWNELVSLNRPVIMEFSLTESEKFYALLIGLKQERLVFYEAPDISYPIEEVLEYFEGYYLILWQSPVANIRAVYPEGNSDAVPWIRKQFSLKRDEFNSASGFEVDYFDDGLKARVIEFQQRHDLKTDGIVGPRTFIHLNNNDPKNISPKLKWVN